MAVASEKNKAKSERKERKPLLLAWAGLVNAVERRMEGEQVDELI
jgi:hypothetical protein